MNNHSNIGVIYGGGYNLGFFSPLLNFFTIFSTFWCLFQGIFGQFLMLSSPFLSFLSEAFCHYSDICRLLTFCCFLQGFFQQFFRSFWTRSPSPNVQHKVTPLLFNTWRRMKKKRKRNKSLNGQNVSMTPCWTSVWIGFILHLCGIVLQQQLVRVSAFISCTVYSKWFSSVLTTTAWLWSSAVHTVLMRALQWSSKPWGITHVTTPHALYCNQQGCSPHCFTLYESNL